MTKSNVLFLENNCGYIILVCEQIKNNFFELCNFVGIISITYSNVPHLRWQ